jgi:trehalose 6-phosphate synthase/phosphatase
VDALGRGDQIKELELKVHPDLKEPLKKLSDDPKTTIVVLSGSGRAVLDKVFLRKIYLFFNVQQHLFL